MARMKKRSDKGQMRAPSIMMTPTEVRAVLGRIPRDLEDMVQFDPRGKRHLYLRSEVMRHAT